MQNPGHTYIFWRGGLRTPMASSYTKEAGVFGAKVSPQLSSELPLTAPMKVSWSSYVDNRDTAGSLTDSFSAKV